MKRFARCGRAFAAGLVVLLAGEASALTVQVQDFGNGTGALGAARFAQSTFHGTSSVVSEDFEDFGVAGGYFGLDGVATNVGTFESIGNSSGGTSARAPFDQLIVRDDGASGRFNTTPFGSFYLDSNDTSGMDWTVGLAGGQAFDRISFFATDIDDVGAVTFNVAGEGSTITLASLLGDAGRLDNANLLLFMITLDGPVTSGDLQLNIDAGDGFGIDDVRISVVPLPAAAWLFGSALLALAGFNSRRGRRRA